MTKGDLHQYIWIKKNIDKLEEKLLEIETKATKITPTLSDEIKSGDNFDKIPRLICDMVKVQEDINNELQKLYAKQREIESSIKGLDEREKYLVRARYLEGKCWEEIAVDMGYSWRQIHNIHSDTLKKLHTFAQ